MINQELKNQIISAEIGKDYKIVNYDTYLSFRIEKEEDGYMWVLYCGKMWSYRTIFPRGKKIGEVGYFKSESGCKRSLINKISGV